MKKYFVAVDTTGKITIGNSVTLSDDFPLEVTQEIFENQQKYQYINGEWIEISEV